MLFVFICRLIIRIGRSFPEKLLHFVFQTRNSAQCTDLVVVGWKNEDRSLNVLSGCCLLPTVIMSRFILTYVNTKMTELLRHFTKVFISIPRAYRRGCFWTC